MEEEVLRNGGPELDISEMFCVRNAYLEKARKYVRMDGKINFAQGGAQADVIDIASRYGIMPEEAYPGLNYGEDKHSHYEMFDVMKGYLDGVLKNSNKKLSTAWEPGFEAILDAYFGKVPETFVYEGKTYTPREFAAAMGLSNANKFANITSFTHHPFYEWFAIEIPDNWMWAKSANVPLADLKEIIDSALENGYTVAWGADVSEGGFKWYEGFAVLPEEVSTQDMTNSELSRWTKMSDKDRAAKRFEIKGPCKEVTVTQESRQKGFDNLSTTDDHGMVIVGIAQDQEGNRFYKVKNSWDTNQVYEGFFYVSEPYLLDKTISVLVNRDAVPKKIAKRIF